MIAASIAVVLVAMLTCPWSLHLSHWPPDVPDAGVSELATEEMSFRRLQSLEDERYRVITADVIIVGTVVSEEAYHVERGPVLTAFTLEVERVLKGTVGQSRIVTSIMGGTLGDRITALPGVDYPEVGQRYVFCLTHDNRWRPGSYLGGSRITRYHVVDGEVVRKGIMLEEFVERIKQQLDVFGPVEQLAIADATVVAVVQKVVNNVIPAPVPLDVVRRDPNHAVLRVSASLVGDISGGTNIRVELPPWLHSGHTIDALEEDTWVLAFLRQGSGSSWCLLDGASSVHALEADSAETALSAARTLVSAEDPSD